MSPQLAKPVNFECQCGATHASIGAVLPPGWTILAGAPRCADCTALAARRLPRRRAARGAA